MISFRRSSIGAILILVFLSWWGQGLAQEKKMVLRVADSLPPGHFFSKNALKYWMETVTKATNGQVEFQYYPAEQLGKAKDLLALTLSGVTDIGYTPPNYVPEKMPLSTVAELPGIFPTSCVGTRAYWSLAKEGILHEKEWAPNGVRPLFVLAIPPYQLWMRKDFKTLKEVENSKIRTAGGAMDLTVRHLLKAVPIRVAAPEIYEAFSRGTMDGGIFSFASCMSYKWHDVLKCTTVGQNFGTAILTYLVSEKRWKTFPPMVQKAMLEAGEATTKRICDITEKEEEELIAQLKKQNFGLLRLSPADEGLLKDAAGAVAEEWAKGLDGKGKPGSQVLKVYREAVQKFR
jgi:TRAP-type C4-dicarboxylate transport system substrate-binding protein